MDLGVDGEPAVREAFDDVYLPQGPAPVEQRAVQPGDEIPQFVEPAGLRQRVASYVVAQVEVRVLFPGPLAEGAQGTDRSLTPQWGDLVVLCGGGEQCSQVRGGRAFAGPEKDQPAHVHRMIAGLPEEKHRIGGRHGWTHRHIASARIAGQFLTRPPAAPPTCASNHDPRHRIMTRHN